MRAGGGAAMAWTLIPYLLLAVGLALLPSGLALSSQHASPSRPRFLNTALTVKFVGAAASRECHGAISAAFERTPHRRSTAPATADTLAFTLRGRDQVRVRGMSPGVEYILARRGDRLFFSYSLGQRRAGSDAFSIDYRIGSGRQGISLLAREPEGTPWQLPVSYFTDADRWDLSPGVAAVLRQYEDFFRRHVPQRCLACHATYLELEPGGTFGPVVHGASCEKCHGPGAAHVRHWRARKGRGQAPPAASGKADPTVVNPRHLSPDLQTEICAECHTQTLTPREGKEVHFRPGQRLRDFYELRASAAGAQHAEADSLTQSACFQPTARKERLPCVVCHAPHEPPPRDSSHYDRRCLDCHRAEHKAGVVAGRGQIGVAAGCVGCHMPERRTDFGHGRFRNHRIAVYRATWSE
jgi:hypothetical protein